MAEGERPLDELLGELEAALAAMAGRSLAVEDLVTTFERAQALAELAEGRLADMQARVEERAG